jgi:glyceraldehyde 3-phosphate dehydrogenase
MSIRVGINGFGRIGRNYLRSALDRGHHVVAVNDVTDPATLAYLLKYDSTYGPLGWDVGTDGVALLVGEQRITVTSEPDPGDVDWGVYGADIVIESTGRFRRRQDAAQHLKSGPARSSSPPRARTWTPPSSSASTRTATTPPATT